MSTRTQANKSPQPIRSGRDRHIRLPRATSLIRQQAERMRDTLAGGTPARRKRKPKTIKKLLELQGESGTHSILDVGGVSPKPEFGTVSPLPPTKLVELFGSERPSHAQIERASSSGALEGFTSERWQGIYVVAYHDGSPSEIFFAGCSGD
jgi:hypothetical protein